MTFEIPKEKMKKLNDWQKKQNFVPLGTIGGMFTYSFTDTTLGTVIKVKNNANQKEIDLSDYENW